VPVRGNLRLDHAEAMVEAALSGTALMQISSYVTAPALARRHLQSVLTAYQIESPPIWAMFPHTFSPTPRLRAFIDFLAKWGASSNFS
jgi:DNA-binding transcriptional LysR family regulator